MLSASQPRKQPPYRLVCDPRLRAGAPVGAPRVVRRFLQQHVPRLEAAADVVDLGKVERPAQVRLRQLRLDGLVAT